MGETRYVAITKNGDNYEVDTNAAPPVAELVPKAQCENYDWHWLFTSISERPSIPQYGNIDDPVPTEELLDIWQASDALYYPDDKFIWAPDLTGVMVTENADTGYAVMKIGDKIYAFHPQAEYDVLHPGIELTFDPTLETPGVFDEEGHEFESGHVVDIYDHQSNLRIRYNGSNISFASCDDGYFEPAGDVGTILPPLGTMGYLYITVGALDTTNWKINLKRYCIHGISY